jgi:hypothetical protein
MAVTMSRWKVLLSGASAIALAGAACCWSPSARAQDPDDANIFAAQPDEDGPPRGGAGRRGGPPERPRDWDSPRPRGPEARPGDRGPDGPPPQSRGSGGGGFGGARGGEFGGARGGGGGFGAGGPRFGPPGGPGPGAPRGGAMSPSLDERISRLEHKLDAVLAELHALRHEHHSFGYHSAGGSQYHMADGPPHGPMGPPPRFGRDFQHFGPPPGMRGGAREWDHPPGPRRAGPPDRPRDDDRRGDDRDDDRRPRDRDRDAPRDRGDRPRD